MRDINISNISKPSILPAEALTSQEHLNALEAIEIQLNELHSMLCDKLSALIIDSEKVVGPPGNNAPVRKISRYFEDAREFTDKIKYMVAHIQNTVNQIDF
jgi:hypothetical protein